MSKKLQMQTSVFQLWLQTEFVSITPSPLSVYFMVTRIAQVWSWGPCHVSGPPPLPPRPPPSKHRLLPKRSFNPVQSSWGFQILCETDFDCRRLLQTSLNGLFVDPFESRRRSSDILFISTILTPEHEDRVSIRDRTFILCCLWLVTS